MTQLGAFGSAALAALMAWATLYSPSGSWQLEYYPNPTLEGQPNAGRLRVAGFDTSRALLPAGFPDREGFSLRLRSCLRLPADGSFAFRVKANDGARLYVDELLVADTAAARSRTATTESLSLLEGSHSIRLEYFNARGPAALTLEMSEAGRHKFRSLRGRTEPPGVRGECDPAS